MQSYLNAPQYQRLVRAVTTAAARAQGAGQLAAALVGHLDYAGLRLMTTTEAVLGAAFGAAEAAVAAYEAQAQAAEAARDARDADAGTPDLLRAEDAHTRACRAYSLLPTHNNSLRLSAAFRAWVELRDQANPVYANAAA